MKKINSALIAAISSLLFAGTVKSSDWSEDNIFLSDHTRINLMQALQSKTSMKHSRPYTVMDVRQYRQVFAQSRAKIVEILKLARPYRHLDKNVQVAFIVSQLADIPYLYSHAMGEGDWQPGSSVYQPGFMHVNQNPVYRLDGLDCQTFVQDAMALLYSDSLDQFDANLLKIAYGAAGNPGGEIVRYYNRNHFIDADFNPVNQNHGWLTDATRSGPLSIYAKTIETTVTRQKWFSRQLQNPADHVQVLSESAGPGMVKRFRNVYANLEFPRFNAEHIRLHYIPKESIAILQPDGSFRPNQALLDKIPAPAVLEIVRDADKWNFYGIKIKNIIGSELAVSHLGLLYRQAFNKGDLIYHQTSCQFDALYRKVCSVKPVTCQKAKCTELMYAHATDAYPIGYYWYQSSPGNYVCTPRQPARGVAYTRCNRVVTMPLYDYLTDYQAGAYWNMNLRSLIGVHIEKLA
ncbi:N-acetylmuramoyl-L-alanine amidase-like domain-containing protein [Aquicella siphonis]|nr:N-acetylmuramoyl-L-alanine amidase-like domain-containing protein [Aquicella siphonis]